MTRAERLTFSTAALDSQDLVDIAEVVMEDLSDVGLKAQALTAEQRRTVRALLSVYFDETPSKTIKVKGGRDGKDYDQERDRVDSAVRMRKLMGYEALPVEQLQMIASRIQAFKGRGARSPFASGQASTSVDTVSVW
jgi:hypothetical protein